LFLFISIHGLTSEIEGCAINGLSVDTVEMRNDVFQDIRIDNSRGAVILKDSSLVMVNCSFINCSSSGM
jgi:hypothetical protein